MSNHPEYQVTPQYETVIETDLEKWITEIRDRRLSDSDDALQAIAESEKYLQQAYEGRYLFELIQNVRDANKEKNVKGSIFIELTRMALTVSNTGAAFGHKGVESITTIGRSPKNSQDFIGFKGIGFKSVLEITQSPQIVTAGGTLFFDQAATIPLLNDRLLKPQEIPIFFIPHYKPATLSATDVQSGIVTRIVLPLKDGVDVSKITERFTEIGIYQLVLLGSLAYIEWKTPAGHMRIKIDNPQGSRDIRVTVNETNHHFRQYTPAQSLPIPSEVIARLDDKERRLYEKSPVVELALVFDTDSQQQLRPIADSKLYLFYPLKINSGFSFLIHSYFLVDPARTTLRELPLNIYLLGQIADYLAGEWLTHVKATDPERFLDFLAFTRNKDVPLLNHLYEQLLEKLRATKFLYDSHTKAFYHLNEIVIADGFDDGLFADHRFQNKRLIYIQNEATRNWLTREVKAEYLSYEKIAEHIEAECERQKATRNLAFFQHLYQYATQHNELNLGGKNVLVTRDWQLLSSEDNVFYGMSQQANIDFPAGIQKHIHFIHAGIRIPDQRQGKGNVGYVEYSTELLVRRLLQLYDNDAVDRMDILISLLQLKLSEKILPLVRQRIWFPVSGRPAWVRPFNRPVYYPRPELQQLYPPEKFVNLEVLEAAFPDAAELEDRLLSFGAWDIPAIYYVDQSHSVGMNDNRFQLLKTSTRLSPSYFLLSGDWELDIPVAIDTWFTQTIFRRYTDYFRLVRHEDNPRLKCKSNWSEWRDVPQAEAIKCFGFIQFLRHQPWIRLDTGGELYPAIKVIGVDPTEYIQPHATLFRRFLNSVPVHLRSNEEFIRLVGLAHLDGQSIQHFKQLFQLTAENYARLEVDEKEFVNFYNKLLSKLFDFYNYFLVDKNDIMQLQSSMWLGWDENQKTLSWVKASNLFYVEDKPAYEILPPEVRQLLQPQFTNRDKNRFGQIAKRLGQDCKKTITQTLLPVEIIKETTLVQFLPNLAECLALTEVLLEVHLDTLFEYIRESIVNICPQISVKLQKGNQNLGTVTNIPHKIVEGEHWVVYVTPPPPGRKYFFYANVLHDLLVELLGRDLQRIKLTFNDFFAQSAPASFVERYEVSSDRVEEIASKLAGMVQTREQTFWLDILNAVRQTADEPLFSGHTVDYPALATLLGLRVDFLAELRLNYDQLDHPENINSLTDLFSRLSLSVADFNNIAAFQVDFAAHYRQKFTGLRYRQKPAFRFALYEFLRNRDLTAKARFQTLLDEYMEKVKPLFEGPCLQVDLNAEFARALEIAYPTLPFPPPANWQNAAAAIDNQYKRNLRAFRQIFQSDVAEQDIYRDFLARLDNRSLLYFEGTIDTLKAKYQLFRLQQEPVSKSSTRRPLPSFQIQKPGLPDGTPRRHLTTRAQHRRSAQWGPRAQNPPLRRQHPEPRPAKGRRGRRKNGLRYPLQTIQTGRVGFLQCCPRWLQRRRL